MSALIVSFINILPLLVSLGDARPITTATVYKREVPQEHSHNKFLASVQTSLALNNPANILDSVFGLLGDAAAAAGAGSITNLACLQQATADQAFTNAKAANDVDGMANALMYRALERNTGKVGLASAICDETAVNPEIAAVTQHQDPASDGAAATNKGIVLALAQQLASIGADPQLALQSGTFAPGDLNDNTGAGNTCDDANDAEGCIFTQNLLVEDASADEIDAAVAGGTGAAKSGSADASGANDGAAAGGAGAAVDNQGNNTAAGQASSNNAVATDIDIGQCADFSMTFAAGVDGRAADEFSFIPGCQTDQTNFAHGSALNPEIISQFMCDTFVNACGKSKSTQAACQTVKTTIDAQLDSGALSKDQSYADAWLSGLEQAFGVQSTSSGSGSGQATAGGAADNAGAAAGSANAGTGADSTAGSGAAASPTPTAAEAGSTGSAANNAGAGGGGNNVQTFTGDLNGAKAPPVIENDASDRPFSVGGDTFVNKSAAIQRSCAQQNNACANAFNSGAGSANVAACNDQEKQCNAAGGA